MNLDIRSIVGKGDLTTERITLKVNSDDDVGDYVLLQTGFAGEGVTTAVYQTLWFPYQKVSEGDLVVVYTKRGSQSSKPLKRTGQAHFFYLDLARPIWDDETKAAVLLHAPSWQGKSLSELQI